MVFVGQAFSATSGLSGISILFSEPLAIGQDLSRFLQIKDSGGRIIQRDWLHSRNPRSVHMPELPAGRYHLEIAAGLIDTNGRQLTIPVQGPITLR